MCKQRINVNEHPKKMMIMQKGLPFESGYKQIKLVNTKEWYMEKLIFNYKGTKV